MVSRIHTKSQPMALWSRCNPDECVETADEMSTRLKPELFS